ncbi:MAG: hypothetical protein ACE5GT_12420, partial [Rhodospirillales bacterium]
MMDTRPRHPAPDTRRIPRVDTGGAGPAALADAEPDRLGALFASAEAHYGPLVLRLGDRLSRRWLIRARNPYTDEIDAVAQRLGRPGAHLLNLSYEWTCTAGVGPDPGGRGMRLIRTLDWPLPGLGRNAVVAGRQGPAGPWLDVTWPGFVGVATALAPGRFAAAINQPPMKRFTGVCWFDWAINRGRLWRSRALPPVHLLRRVFERAATYAEAKAMLTGTPLAIPAFFTIAGVQAGEGAVIERREESARVLEAPASVANHWLGDESLDRMRGLDSPGRWRMMEDVRDRAGDDFAWVQPPILNETTRLAVAANPARGSLLV